MKKDEILMKWCFCAMKLVLLVLMDRELGVRL